MKDILAAVIRRADDPGQIGDADFVIDGIVHCGNCKTAKEFRLPTGNKVRSLCRCETEKRDAEEAERRAREKAERIAEYKRSWFKGKTAEDMTFQQDDLANPKASDAARRYVENFSHFQKEGKGLLFLGNVGTGKTFLAAAICNELLNQGYWCKMTDFARLINEANSRKYDKQEYLDDLNRFDLLAIDDLGAERDTEFMAETIFNIIDGRNNTGKPLIVTTNLTSEELKNPTDIRRERIYSRLLRMCIPVEVSGIDRRKKNLRDTFDENGRILGLK